MPPRYRRLAGPRRWAICRARCARGCRSCWSLGDALEQVFANGRAVHVGAGAIWLRVNKPRDLPGLALALKAWRGDRSPDGVVLTLTPDTHTDDTLTQTLRAHRQALSDTARLLATRVPGYVAVYQRLTQDNSPHWFGLSATSPLRDVRQFEGVCKRPKQKRERTTARGLKRARRASRRSSAGPGKSSTACCGTRASLHRRGRCTAQHGSTVAPRATVSRLRGKRICARTHASTQRRLPHRPRPGRCPSR